MLPREMAPITVMPKMATQKISVGPNRSAICDKGGARNRSARNPVRLPKAQAMAARFRARWGSPFLAMGNPSKQVTTSAGSPGTFMRMALMLPPYIDAQ